MFGCKYPTLKAALKGRDFHLELYFKIYNKTQYSSTMSLSPNHERKKAYTHVTSMEFSILSLQLGRHHLPL